MSCDKEREEHTEAIEGREAAARLLKQYEGAMFGGTSPKPIFLSDLDIENLERLEAEVEAAERLEQEKARAYDEAKRSHRE